MRFLLILLLPHLIFGSEKKIFSDKNVCCICFDAINPESNDFLKTQCGHDFHAGCLGTWKNTNNSCPNCRCDNPHALVCRAEKNKMLEHSAYYGDLCILQEMIRQGADVNSPGGPGGWDTALKIATGQGKIDAMEMLLKNGANINAQGLSNRTALMIAVSGGNLDAIKLLLKYEADTEMRDGLEWTALMTAVFEGKNDAVEVLLRNKADVDTRDRSKLTPLMYAVRNRNFDIAEQLLQHDADTEAVSSRRQWTALDYAAHGYSEPFLDYSAGHSIYDGPRWNTRWIPPSLRMVKLLLDKGAQPRISPGNPELAPEIKELIDSRSEAKSYVSKLLKLD